ncbi:ribosomal-processing cysteine protease Prp [Lacticigenium naphthae]|uniref:ribosomal-processing cysteine protease Prp n=1 Tax=Lacticigenium naphthae TaxID=515351 RepID=UPI00041235A6|nr:ribosomal-processing cysteine protease Prp [Lacticigenium naphthae]
MIQASFHRNDVNEIVSVEMTGHADSGPYGYDIVCAAASALSIGAVNSIEKLSHVKPITEIDEKNGGYLYVTFPLNELSIKQQEIIQLLLESLFISISDIANEYADHINVRTIK